MHLFPFNQKLVKTNIGVGYPFIKRYRISRRIVPPMASSKLTILNPVTVPNPRGDPINPWE